MNKELFDIVRINHFAGMVKIYTVPYDKKEAATSGKWIKGPGKKLINAIKEELDGDLAMVDDYTSAGLLPGVKKLLNKTGWIGTKVLMFAFDGDPTNEHLPHNYTDNHVAAYIGTHDNETIVGSFRDKTTADVAIVQMQDILELGSEARMNYPSTVGQNWRWRLTEEEALLDENRRAWIRNLAAVYRR